MGVTITKFKMYKIPHEESKSRDNCKKKISKYKKMREEKYGR